MTKLICCINGITLEIAIEEKRKAKGWSKSKLAAYSGVARSYITELEHGKYIPTVYTLSRIAKALGCTMDELIKFE